MAHGGYGKRSVAGRPPFAGNAGVRGRGKGPGVRKDNEKKSKIVSIKNQIRSIERLLKKTLPAEMKDFQEKRLEDLRKQASLHARSELERKMSLRYRKVKFFERRKIERRIRRLEKQQRAAADDPTVENTRHAAAVSQQLLQLKEDLEYVKFFPKTEKYVSLFMGNDDELVVARRKELREKVKSNLAAAAAAGVDLEETGSEDDAMDMSEDDFFMAGSSSDDADADDELTDKSPRLGGDDRDDTSKEVVIPGSQSQLKHGSTVLKSTDKKFKKAPTHSNGQRQKTARVLMPPPRLRHQSSSSNNGGTRQWNMPSTSSSKGRKKLKAQTFSSTSEDFPKRQKTSTSSHSWEIVKGSSTSDVQQKPKRKRSRQKKKK